MIGLTTHFRLDHNRVACGDVNGVYGCHGNPRETTCKRCLRTLAHREAVAYATDMANRGGGYSVYMAVSVSRATNDNSPRRYTVAARLVLSEAQHLRKVWRHAVRIRAVTPCGIVWDWTTGAA